MTDAIKLPAITECQLESGYDSHKDRNWIDLVFDGIIIREYFIAGSDREEMAKVVNRARYRLAYVLRKRQIERAKTIESRKTAKKLMRLVK